MGLGPLREWMFVCFLCAASMSRRVATGATLGMLPVLAEARQSLADEMFKADVSMRAGDVAKASGIYRQAARDFGDSEAFRSKHVEFLMACGEYGEVLERFDGVRGMEERCRRARECLSILLSNNTRLVASLVAESPYSQPVLKAHVQVCLIDERLGEAEKFVKRARALFPEAREFAYQEMQLRFLTGAFSAGIRMLDDLGHCEMASSFRDVLEAYESTRNGGLSASNRYARLSKLLRHISLVEVDSNFFPSIFSVLKLDVLFELCKSGVESGVQRLTSKSKHLYSKRSSEDTMYLHIMALILDGSIEEAEEKYRMFSFRNTRLRNHVLHRLEAAKAQRERDRKEKEERRRRRQSRGGHGSKGDFLGYYKAMGFKEGEKPSEKEIKSAYRKTVVKNKKRKKTEAEEKEWEEEFKKLNKAFGVLSDKEKREMYDKGVDPDNPQQFSGFGDDPFQDVFRGFGNFGFFDFPGDRQGGRRTTTTYFYF